MLAIASMEASQPVVCENGEDPNEKCPCLLQNNALGDGISWNIMEWGIALDAKWDPFELFHPWLTWLTRDFFRGRMRF